MLCERPDAARRAMLKGGGALFAWAYAPRLASAAGARDPRFVTIVLRGALDGLSAVAPLGDPDYAGLHGALALAKDGPHAALPLDGFFALNPAMPRLAALYARREAAIVHAVATPYRDRSHFDGQDVLESGFAGPGQTQTGWLNRVLAALPKGERVRPGAGLAVGATTPLILRGSADVLGWAPTIQAAPNADLAMRVMALYQARDPKLAEALHHGLEVDRIAAGTMMAGGGGGTDTPDGMRRAAEGAARLLAAPDGPRLAALSFDGWDTHVNEGGATGRLALLLGGLDGAIDTLRQGLGPAWADTIVLAATEFGRTVHINGSVGTDHGTGTVAFLAGGALHGGRMIADWPGLKPAALFENRDLRPTTDLRAVIKGILADHLGMPKGVLASSIFPDSGAVVPMSSLVA